MAGRAAVSESPALAGVDDPALPPRRGPCFAPRWLPALQAGRRAFAEAHAGHAGGRGGRRSLEDKCVPKRELGNERPPRGRAVFDLLRVPFIGRFLRTKAGRRAMQAVLLLVALAVVLDGFFGSPASPVNLAGVLPWIYWRGLTVIVLLVAGNFFCMACPFMLPRELERRLELQPHAWPRALRSKWLAVAHQRNARADD